MKKKLGKYELFRKLGSGATSAVYLGYDPFAQREVAIKVATPEVLADPINGKRYSRLFLNEASLIGKLRHPHIVQIFDAVVTEKLCYIVMENVGGQTLDDFTTADTLLPIDRVVEFIFKATRALAFAHHAGVTHRDIKPANILLAGDADIKVSDFGAAITADQRRTLVTGIGSPAYMSPEQIREVPVDHRTDIYSLGVVMFQLLTGHLPFEASTQAAMIHRIVHDPLPAPSTLRADLPAVLDRIVARATARDRADRYATWEAFSQDLAKAARTQQLKLSKIEFAETEKFDTLRAMPFFRRFSDVQIWEVVRLSSWQHFSPGTCLMREGEPGDALCLLASGELAVSKAGKQLDILRPGACFGEMAVINRLNPRRSADITAIDSADVISVRSDKLESASDGCRMAFYQSFLEVLAERLDKANQRLAQA